MKFRILFIFFILLGLGLKSFGQTSDELKKRRNAIQKEINDLQQSLSKTSNSKRLTLKQINSLNAKIQLRQAKINNINTEMNVLDVQIVRNKNSISNLQKQLEDLKGKYAGMVKFAQRNQNAYNKLMFIFAAKDFNQAYMRIKYLQQFGEKRREQADKIVATQQEIKTKIDQLNHNVKEKTALLADQVQEKQKLGTEKDNTSKVFNQYKKEEKGYINDIAQHKKQQAALDQQIRAVIRREIEIARRKAEEEARRVAAAKAAADAKAGKTIATTDTKAAPIKAKTNSEILRSTPEAEKLSNDFQNNRGNLPWPVKKGFISEGYGMHTFQGAQYPNDGVNIRTADYSSVYTVFAGEVVSVSPLQGKYAIIIKHGEYFTVYNNLRTVSVRANQKVSTGQEIGKMGSEEGGTDVQLQIWKGSSKMNPEGWIKH